MAQTTLTPEDIHTLSAAGHRSAAPIRRFAESMQRAIEGFNASLEFWRIIANTPAAVAGLEGRYHVRGALSTRSQAARDVLIRGILDGTAGGCILLTPTNRAVVAAAVLRGWTQTHPGDLPAHGISWGRVLGDTRVLVTREAAS